MPSVGERGFASYSRMKIELEGIAESTMKRKAPTANETKNRRYTSLRA